MERIYNGPPFSIKTKNEREDSCGQNQQVELEWTSLAARRPQCATGGNYCFLTSQLENIQTTNTHTAPVFQHQTRARVRLQLKIFLLLFLFVRGIETQTFSSLQEYKQLLLVFFHFFRSPLPHRQDILNTSMLKITNNIIGENFPGTSSLHSPSDPGNQHFRTFLKPGRKKSLTQSGLFINQLQQSLFYCIGWTD